MSIKSHNKNDYIAYGLLSILSVFMLVIGLLNTGIMGGADSYMHHLMAKWSFTYPHLFLDHWGKPIFTILSAPMAKFGLFGSVLFNILTTLLTAFFSYKIADALGIKNPWVAILFTVFTPILFLVSFSSLTEPLFALFVILTTYLFVKEKYSWSAVIISFIPFVRTEGAIFIPLMAIALIMVRNYKAIPFLLLGTIAFSIIGFWVFDDLFWIITRLPYSAQSSAYGHGTISHFINKSPTLFGWPILILFGVGILFSITQSVQKKDKHFAAITFLLLTISIGYFSAHSIVWAFGMGSSAGLERVMAGIAPIIALVALIGYDSIIQKIKFSKISPTVITIIIGVILILEGVSKHRLPITLKREEIEISEMADYIKDNKLDTNFIFYSNPTSAYFLNLDHFSHTKSSNYIPFKGNEREVKSGSLIIWDAHFSPNGNQVPKADLDNNTYYKKLKTVTPKNPFTVYSGQNYEVILYQKLAK
jgi:hypothetical protein